MLARHNKELEHVKRMGGRRMEEILRQQAVEKRAMPKRIRAERKTRELMFRESLRIGAPRISVTDVQCNGRDPLKAFQDQEEKRCVAGGRHWGGCCVTGDSCVSLSNPTLQCCSFCGSLEKNALIIW